MLRLVNWGRSALMVAGPTSVPIRHGNSNRFTGWPDAVATIGRPGLHFHDLRHTGNMLAAGSKITTRDLMRRMGHESMTAALSYQHAGREADRSIAAQLYAPDALDQDDDEDGGEAAVLVPTG